MLELLALNSQIEESFIMQRLYLEAWKAFIRWHAVGSSGEPVIYLPGLSMSSVSSFLPVAAHSLMGDKTGIMLDYIGSGVSDHSDTFSFSLKAHAETVAFVLQELGYTSCHFVGHSFGGSVAIQLALTRPDLVRSLFIAEGNLLPGGGPGSRSIAANSKVEFVNKVFPKMLNRIREDALIKKSGPDVLASSWSIADVGGIYENAISLVNLPKRFEKDFLTLDIPRCFMFSEENFPAKGTAGTADIPNVERLESFGVLVEILPNSGHEMMISNPEDFTKILSGFLITN